jgi:hypothetical protein
LDQPLAVGRGIAVAFDRGKRAALGRSLAEPVLAAADGELARLTDALNSLPAGEHFARSPPIRLSS